MVQTLVPESVLKKRRTLEEIQAKKAADAVVAKKASRAKKGQIFRRAEKYVKEYKQMEKTAVRLRRQAKAKGNFYVPAEAKVAFVIRIRGIIGVSPKVQWWLVSLIIILYPNQHPAKSPHWCEVDYAFHFLKLPMQWRWCLVKLLAICQESVGFSPPVTRVVEIAFHVLATELMSSQILLKNSSWRAFVRSVQYLRPQMVCAQLLTQSNSTDTYMYSYGAYLLLKQISATQDRRICISVSVMHHLYVIRESNLARQYV